MAARKIPGDGRSFPSRELRANPGSGRGGRIELRMRLPAAPREGGGAPLRGWLLCKRGFWLLVGKAAWPRGAAAVGQVRGFEPPVEKLARGLPASQHGKVASGLRQGYLGAGIRRHRPPA